MAEQYCKQDVETKFDDHGTTVDANQALFNDAYDKCMGGGPGSKCGAPFAPQNDSLSSSLPSKPVDETSADRKKQSESNWFKRVDLDGNDGLSQKEVNFAGRMPETRNLAVVRLMQQSFESLAGADGLITISDLEQYVKRSEKNSR
jgi:hypothetical protein